MQLQRSCVHSRTANARVVRAEAITDNAARLKGPVGKVYHYVSNFQNLAAWYPGVTAVTRVKGKGDTVSINSRFSVETKIARWNVLCKYDVVDMNSKGPGKQIVYRASSELHVSSHQLLFMPDPLDPLGYTNVRYVQQIQLRNMAAPLQPLATGFVSRTSQGALASLTALLASPETPLQYIVLEEELAPTPPAPPSSAWSQASQKLTGLFESWGLGGSRGSMGSMGSMDSMSSMGSMGSRDSRDEGERSTRGSSAVVTRSVDSLGYYVLLGLDVQNCSAVMPDQVKAAYRKSAQTLHPDKFIGSSPEDRQRAEANFQKLQKAYSVLKDADSKRMYDAGKILEEFLV